MGLLEKLKKYCADVESGNIVACKKHKQSCMRFISDCVRSESGEFPYAFIEERAELFFAWMRMFKHRKGILAGQVIEPSPIQEFIFGNVYGWYHRDTGRRRFNKCYWQVARKNAKSQTLAIVGLFETMVFCKGETAEVYCAATKTEQAKIVWDEAVAMLKSQRDLDRQYTVKYGRITRVDTGSVMRPLSEEDRRTGDGLHPQCGIIDEYHAHETSEIYDVIDSGMGARLDPLLVIITTAGFDLANPCYRVEYDLVSKILDPDNPVNIESYFVMINELETNTGDQPVEVNGRQVPPGGLIDDIRDETAWEKANPIICSYDVGRDYLRKKLQEAIEVPEKMRNFLTKHMNVWVNRRESGYMDMARWSACGSGSMPDVSGMAVYTGVDLSATIDLTSVAFEVPLDDGGYWIRSHSFMPADTLEVRAKRDKVPFDLWVSQGWITVTPGAEVDYHFVFEYIRAEYERMRWRRGEVCFDRALATWLTQEMENDGFLPIDIPQSYTGLSAATKDFRGKVYQGRIVHDNNPVLTWATSNAVTRAGPSENIMLDKSRARSRIDPIAAVINAHVRAMIRGEQPGYNTRGMRSL